MLPISLPNNPNFLWARNIGLNSAIGLFGVFHLDEPIGSWKRTFGKCQVFEVWLYPDGTATRFYHSYAQHVLR